MALAHAIMVSLLDRPQTGYELGKRFGRTVGFFWKASHQQIYQELHRMAARDWVSAETVPQSERPNRIVYELTGTGRRALDEWIAIPSDPPSVKEELLVKLFALGDADVATLLAQVGRRLSLHQDRLAEYEAIRERYYPEPSTLRPRQRGRYLGLRMGILSEQASIAWCREALALLDERREAVSGSCSRDGRER